MSDTIFPPHLVVKAMRDSGFKNAAYAISELIDNAVDAKSTNIELLCGEGRTTGAKRRIEQIAVIDNGVLQQFDIPSVIYNKPTNIFVSKFVGSPSINLFKANVVNNILFVGEDKICETILNNQEVILGVRPENIKISDNGIPVKFCFEEISGGVKYLYFESEISMNKYIIIQQDNDYKVSGEQFFLKLHKNKINIFDQNTELLIDF